MFTRSTWHLLILSLGCWGLFAPPAPGQYLDQIGYTALQNRLGASTPNGAGVWMMQVEASVGTEQAPVYGPDPSVAAGRAGFTIDYRSPVTPPTQFSGHATSVAAFQFGNSSMASGVTRVDAYEAVHWITDGMLGAIGGPLPPTTNVPKISNHSYIGSTGILAQDEEILARADYFVDRASHILVVGVGNNGAGNAPAPLLGSGYNSIAVGRSDGQHNSGLTSIAGAGRVKPDLVAPLGAVSFATPTVAAAAALLVQTAGADTFASRPETIKATLMAGATKAEFGSNWSRTTTRPLDPIYGAGELNIDNSHRILSAGRQPASSSSTVGLAGWDHNSIDSTTSTRAYFFDVPAEMRTSSVSIVLSWNREFTEGSLTSRLANLDLSLFQVDANFSLLGSPIDQSLSTVDNVEHIWLTTSLLAGRYGFLVNLNNSGASFANYAIAWQVQLVPVPEPGLILFIACSAVGLWRTRILVPRMFLMAI